MNRSRLGAVALALAAVTMGLTFRAPRALAAAEVHNLNLVFSATPTSLDGGDFNELVGLVDRNLDAQGLEPLDKITMGWLFQSELRYFVRRNIAVVGGVGQLKAVTKREYLPALQSSVNLRGEVLTVPIHVGAAYYLQPYNQGDFQARAFIGAGVVSQVTNRSRFRTEASFPGVYVATRSELLRDAPGWYAEIGGHMFFASRFSVMISGTYRSSVIRGMVDDVYRIPASSPVGPRPFTLDLSGAGIRASFAVGL